METTLVKEKEVCEYLNISRTTFWRLKKDGLPTLKVGNSYRYNIDEIKNWVVSEGQQNYQTKQNPELYENLENSDNEDKIINDYRININYLLEHNKTCLSKIFTIAELEKLKSNLKTINDEELTNQQIVRKFSDEFIKLQQEKYQKENRQKDFDENLNNFINQDNNGIRIVWGNCLDTLKKMETESVQLMVTSPPYYNARDYSQWENIDLYLEDMRMIIRESYRVLDNHRVWVWNVGDIFDNDRKTVKSTWGKRRLPLGAYFIKLFEEEGFEFVDDVIWDKGEVESKRHMNGGMNYPFYQYPLNCYEHILIFHKHRLDTKKIPCPVCGSLKVNGNSQSEIGVQSWECKNEKCFVRSVNNRGKRFSLRTNMMQEWHDNDNRNFIEKKVINKWRRDIVAFPPVIKINHNGTNVLGHSAPFPYDIPEMAIKYFTFHGEKVLDPFAGSFTTPIVARNLKRIGIGIELNKTMFHDAIINHIKASKNMFNDDTNLYNEFTINPV